MIFYASVMMRMVMHGMVGHGMIHLDGLLFRLVACNGRIYHAKNHGDVRKNQECCQQGNANDVSFLRLSMLKEQL